jgi:hypothetical protein
MSYVNLCHKVKPTPRQGVAAGTLDAGPLPEGAVASALSRTPPETPT